MNENYGRDLDLNLLRTFAVVAECQSVTRAAGRTHEGLLPKMGTKVDGRWVLKDVSFDVHRGEISEEHGRRPNARLAERHHGKLKRQSPGFPHAALHVLGQFAEVEVARRQFRPCVADTDDGSAFEHAFRQSAPDPAAMNEPVLIKLGEPGR